MLINLTFLALHAGECERARDLAMQGLRLALEMNNKVDIADSLAGVAGVMGVIWIRMNHLPYARSAGFQPAPRAIHERDKCSMESGMTGQLHLAARLLGAWEAAFEWMDTAALPSAKREHDRTIATVRAQLDDIVFQEARAEGRAMALKQAVEYALRQSDL